MNVNFDFRNDTICIYGQTVTQDSFRDFVIDNYPYLVKKHVTKSILRTGVVEIVEGNTKTISSAGNTMFAIDWENIYSIAVRYGYIITDFIIHLKNKKQWNYGS